MDVSDVLFRGSIGYCLDGVHVVEELVWAAPCLIQALARFDQFRGVYLAVSCLQLYGVQMNIVSLQGATE